MSDNIIVKVADSSHTVFAEQICALIEESAKQRGTGIAKRSPDYIIQKMNEGKAIIALTKTSQLIGFCYVETWGHGKFVANSGLIVNPEFRKGGIATKIKEKAFELSRQKYPDAKIFGITTSLAVMKINSDLGYRPVTFSELTDDETFWKGCSGCVNYDILNRTNRKHCLCTGMLFDPAEEKSNKKWDFLKNLKIHENWLKIKQKMLLFREREKDEKKNSDKVLV